MLSDFAHKTHTCSDEGESHSALLSLCLHRVSSLQRAPHSRPITPDINNNMGNTSTACQLSNYSKRNVRVFVTEKALEVDAFIASESGGDEKISSVLPQDKKFIFRKDIDCIRVLASQTQEVPWEAQHFVSIFVENEDDENICSKQIIHNMALSAPVTVLLYDV